MPNNTYYSPDFANTKGKGLGNFLAYLFKTPMQLLREEAYMLYSFSSAGIG